MAELPSLTAGSVRGLIVFRWALSLTKMPNDFMTRRGFLAQTLRDLGAIGCKTAESSRPCDY